MTVPPVTTGPPRPALIHLLRAPMTSIASDRKSTRLNSSHLVISYAVFCLKKKNKTAYHLLLFSSITSTTGCFLLVSAHIAAYYLSVLLHVVVSYCSHMLTLWSSFLLVLLV